MYVVSAMNDLIDSDYISKIQERQKQTREVDLKENKFWLDYISSHYYHKLDPIKILEYDKLIDGLSVRVIQEASQKYLNTDQYVKVVLYPEMVE